MSGGAFFDGLIAGGKPVGIGLVSYAVVRLFMFLCTFVAARMDARQARLDAQEARLEASLGKRLDHLEAEVARIPILEEAVNILAAELRQHDPANSKLSEVAKLLRRAVPVAPSRPDFDDLLGKMK